MAIATDLKRIKNEFRSLKKELWNTDLTDLTDFHRLKVVCKVYKVHKAKSKSIETRATQIYNGLTQKELDSGPDRSGCKEHAPPSE